MIIEFFCMTCDLRVRGEQKLYAREPMMFCIMAHEMQGKEPCKLPIFGPFLYPVRPVALCPVWAKQLRRELKKAITFGPSRWQAKGPDDPFVTFRSTGGLAR